MKDEHGHIVVETIGTFVPFVLLLISILSLINIVTVQARVHYALTQAANSLSVYSYTLEVLGVSNDLTALSNKAQRVAKEADALRNDVNSMLEGIGNVSDVVGAVGSGGRIVDRVYSWGEEAAGDPKAVLQLLMNYGLGELRDKLFGELVRPLIGRYLGNGNMTGDAYLRSAGVMNKRSGKTGLDSLEFYRFDHLGTGNSVLLDSDGNVKLTVEYEILYTFGGLPLPFKPTLRITQTVITKAWLNGSGKGYW